MQLLAVAIGGFIGAILRYLIGIILVSPFSTFTVNIVGSFFLAWILTSTLLKLKLPSTISLGLSTGLLGSFTTFSTFSVDSINLFSSSATFALIYIFATVACGLLFSFLGYQVAIHERKSKG